MNEQFKISEQYQNLGKESFDAVVRAYGEANKGFQAIAAEMTDCSKIAFEDATRAFQQLVSAKSAEQVFELQSQYAKKAYDDYIAEAQSWARCGLTWHVRPASRPSGSLPDRSLKSSHCGSKHE